MVDCSWTVFKHTTFQKTPQVKIQGHQIWWSLRPCPLEAILGPKNSSCISKLDHRTPLNLSCYSCLKKKTGPQFFCMILHTSSLFSTCIAELHGIHGVLCTPYPEILWINTAIIGICLNNRHYPWLLEPLAVLHTHNKVYGGVFLA